MERVLSESYLNCFILLPLVYQFAVRLPHEVATATALECGEYNAHLYVSHVLKSSQNTSLEEHLHRERGREREGERERRGRECMSINRYITNIVESTHNFINI